MTPFDRIARFCDSDTGILFLTAVDDHDPEQLYEYFHLVSPDLILLMGWDIRTWDLRTNTAMKQAVPEVVARIDRYGITFSNRVIKYDEHYSRGELSGVPSMQLLMGACLSL